MGTLDQMLLRPAHIFIQVLSADFVLRRIGRILQGGLVLALALLNLGIAWSPAQIAYLVLLIVNLTAFFGGLFVLGSAFTFWTVDSIEIMNIFTYGGTEMMSYPMSIYPRSMRAFFTFILPAIFLNYFPALHLLGKPDPLGYPWVAPYIFPLVGFGMLAAGASFWMLALRRYQSTGS
jgi:ABC-2 type transport system permease protein